jgi:hypothetical protein
MKPQNLKAQASEPAIFDQLVGKKNVMQYNITVCIVMAHTLKRDSSEF